MNDNRTAPLEVAERRVRDIRKAIVPMVPRGWGYTVVLSEFGHGGRLAYASNCRRDSVVDLSRELAQRIETGDEESFTIEHSDATYRLALDAALELLASIGKRLTDVTDEEERKPFGEDLELAEGLVLEHRPDLLLDD